MQFRSISCNLSLYAINVRTNEANCSIENTWFNVKRTYVNGCPKHSKKPTFFYELIEKVSSGSKIELFARNQREGWAVFGNEVENSIIV